MKNIKNILLNKLKYNVFFPKKNDCDKKKKKKAYFCGL